MRIAQTAEVRGRECTIWRKNGIALKCQLAILRNDREVVLVVERLEADFRCAVGQNLFFRTRQELTGTFGQEVADILEEVFPRF